MPEAFTCSVLKYYFLLGLPSASKPQLTSVLLILTGESSSLIDIEFPLISSFFVGLTKFEILNVD
jgi:hypothetical protein